MSILCSAADAVSSDNWFTLFKVLTLNVAMWIVFLHLSNFGLGLSSGTEFSKTLNDSSKAPASAERTFCSSARRAMQFGHMVWIGHGNLSLAIFLFSLSIDATLTNEYQ